MAILGSKTNKKYTNNPTGGTADLSDGDDRRIFLGLKFSIPGYIWVGKFGKYVFLWLDLSGDLRRVFWYSIQSEDAW